MEDGYRLIDYGINLNDVIQLMVRAAPPTPPIEKSGNEQALNEESKENEGVIDPKDKNPKTNVDECHVDTACQFYEVISNKSSRSVVNY